MRLAIGTVGYQKLLCEGNRASGEGIIIDGLSVKDNSADRDEY